MKQHFRPIFFPQQILPTWTHAKPWVKHQTTKNNFAWFTHSNLNPKEITWICYSPPSGEDIDLFDYESLEPVPKKVFCFNQPIESKTYRRCGPQLAFLFFHWTNLLLSGFGSAAPFSFALQAKHPHSPLLRFGTFPGAGCLRRRPCANAGNHPPHCSLLCVTVSSTCKGSCHFGLCSPHGTDF